jgi:hypothetical protein
MDSQGRTAVICFDAEAVLENSVQSLILLAEPMEKQVGFGDWYGFHDVHFAKVTKEIGRTYRGYPAN